MSREICGECRYNKRDFSKPQNKGHAEFYCGNEEAAVMEYRLCMTIVAKILKKRAIKGRKEKHGKN